jgi:hypothetical protein
MRGLETAEDMAARCATAMIAFSTVTLVLLHAPIAANHSLFQAVMGIRIRRISMFLDLRDPDPLGRGTDPAPAPDPSLFLINVLS